MNEKAKSGEAKTLELREKERLRREASAKKWLARSKDAEKLRDEWRKRWSLSLAVANGAGIVGLTSVLLDPTKSALSAEVLIISVWVFLIGICCSGTIPLIRSFYFEQDRQWSWVVSEEARYGGLTTLYVTNEYEPESSDEYRKLYWNRRARFERVSGILEYFAAGTFLLGLVIPAVAFTIKLYF